MLKYLNSNNVKPLSIDSWAAVYVAIPANPVWVSLVHMPV